MKNLFRTLPLTALTLLVSAALADAALAQLHEHDGHAGHATMHAAAAEPQIIDGVQVVEITVGPMGYSASTIALEAGMPARLVFTRTEDGGCTHQVQIPDAGIEVTDLPLGEPVAVEFTPQEGGTFTFACGMGMVTGTILVKT